MTLESEELASLVRDRPVEHYDRLLALAQAEVGKAVVGQQKAIETMLVAILARGHILIEGPPGTAKTVLARAVARIVGGHFGRVQFTPDTTPSEILGDVIRKQSEDVFEKGPIFTTVFLADEINRGPARTQAALLEAMQERHVTVRGRTYWIDSPFVVVATQNPFEHNGVFPIAESQLDRFLVKIDISYADEASELAMLELPQRGTLTDAIGDIYPFLANGGLLRIQEIVDETVVPRHVAERVTKLVRFTRTAEGVELGASSRAALHLVAAAKARATLHGRRTVEEVDVDAMADGVLTHRLIASDPRSVVQAALSQA